MKRLLSIVLLLAALPAHAAFDWDPFYQSLTATNGATFQAWRPFYSTSVDGEHWRQDYLWPLYTRKGFKEETYGRFLFFGWSTDFSPETSRHRTWVIPIYFQGTSADEENYFAIFPLGGTIDEFLGRDKLWFVLFPLYAESSINDVHTTTVLWPIGSKTTGPRVERFRVWPLYGTSVLKNEYRKKFVLWPIYNSVEYTNTRNPGGGFILFPVYGRVATEKALNQWFLPPFFRFAHGDGQRIVYAPWPFIQWADGDVYKRYCWPIYGRKHEGPLTRQFWLWPFIWNSKTEYARHEQHRRMVLPLFYYESDLVTKPTKHHEVGDVTSRYWKLWPLMSWERNDETSRFRMLELWPIRNTLGLERNWTPFWTLYKREESQGVVNRRLLWGLYSQTTGEKQTEWSLLKGFAGYKNNNNKHSIHLLFFRFGGKEDEP